MSTQSVRRCLILACLPMAFSLSVAAEQSVIEVCSDCHRVDGTAGDNTIPNLWGQSEQYLAEQVKAFRSQTRTSPFMQPITHEMSDAELKAAVAHYASLPPAKSFTLQWRGEQWPGDMSLGEQLAYNGKWQNDVPACVACHGPSGVGVKPSFPRLAGQNADYLKNQLLAWQKDQRPPGVLGTMVPIAKALNADEIEAVAQYFAQLGEDKQ